MDPVRELPYWPAAMALLIEAGQMTASDYVPTYPNYRLHPKGRPQMPFIQKATFVLFGSAAEGLPSPKLSDRFGALNRESGRTPRAASSCYPIFPYKPGPVRTKYLMFDGPVLARLSIPNATRRS